jgi:hypothetical protein
MTLAGRTVSVPCGLKPMLLEASRQNPALARFLAAGARSK